MRFLIATTLFIVIHFLSYGQNVQVPFDQEGQLMEISPRIGEEVSIFQDFHGFTQALCF